MTRVISFTYNQADWGLLRPILIDLASDEIHVDVFPFTSVHEDWIIRMGGLSKYVKILPGWFQQKLVQSPMSALVGSAAVQIDSTLGYYSGLYDAAIILGDRNTEVAAAMVCMNRDIPVHHLFGGDVSGCKDDRMRDVVTTLSSHAYAFNRESFLRLNGLAATTGHKFKPHHVRLPDVECDESAGLVFKKAYGNYVLACLHPETTRNEPVETWIQEIVQYAKANSAVVLWQSPNRDDGSERIVEAWKRYSHTVHLERVPREKFLGLLKHAHTIIGNSSSFVLDAPLVGKESVVKILGHRQHGRTNLDSKGAPVGNKLKENIL